MNDTQTTASPRGTADDPSARSTEFVAAQGGGEGASAESLLVAAYILMWAIVFGFILLSFRRQAKVEGRLAELERALRKIENK